MHLAGKLRVATSSLRVSMSDQPTSLPSSRRDRRGFTLIELLVVIMIIAVLLGLLFPAISFVQSIAKKNKARSLLASIQGALNLYKDSQGTYPDVIYDATGAHYPVTSPFDIATENPYARDAAKTLIDALRVVDFDTFRKNSADELKPITDPWGKAVRYRPARYYPFSPGHHENHINSDKPPMAQSYQLWSLGPNSRDQTAAALSPIGTYGDDIVAWSK